MTEPAFFTLSFVGDVMLGRLIDQFFPEHVHSENDRHNADHFMERHPSILGNGNYTHSSPWGTTLPLLRASDLLLINLETSVTTSPEPWPNKVFNYRMHPSNLAPILHAAHVDYASLANNHTLDFGNDGLVETAWTLHDAGIAFTGAGESPDQAFKPAVLYLPRKTQEIQSRRVDGAKTMSTKEQTSTAKESGYLVHVYSVADHPRDWASIPGFHILDYSPATRIRLRTLLLSNGSRTDHPPKSDSNHDTEESDIYHHTAHHHHNALLTPESRPALKIFSVHWGPNYRWHPADRIRSLAHFLIDECDVDIVHGHSSHHVQGVEVYRGSVILYGCGDFVDDYALNREFRNDLGGVWRVIVKEGKEKGKGIVLDRLEIFPARVEKFRAMLLDVGDRDHGWVRERIRELSLELGTMVKEEVGDRGQIIVDIDG